MEIENRIVKASFRECPLSEREKFSKSSCLMPISIGQEVHEGDKFTAVLKLVNRNFSKCTILIDDTVQRHTLAIIQNESSTKELYNEALRQGSEWLVKYLPEIEQHFDIPFSIIRWNKWLNHNDFQNSLNQIKQSYNADPEYRNAIDENINDFLTRYQKKHGSSNFDWKIGEALCFNYLIEECAAMCLWIEENCEYELYPSGRNKAMTATYKRFIEPKAPNLLISVALRFKKYGKKLAVTNSQETMIACSL